MYTGKTKKTVDRYEYNVDKILNVRPTTLPESDVISDAYINSLKIKVKANIDNLKSILGSQLTTRQKSVLDEVSYMLRYNFHWSELFGIHEFRFEGAGGYRSGTDDDSYNSTKVTKVSVDFTSLSGNHNESGFPADYNDGFGLYGAMSVVFRNGDIVGVFFRASTLPDKIDQHATLAEGTYSFKVGTHPISGGYKALNVYKLNDFTSSGRNLPAVIDKNDGDGIVSGVNCHKGYNTERGSEGCQTINYDTDYTEYIALFETGEKGKYVMKRLCSLPTV